MAWVLLVYIIRMDGFVGLIGWTYYYHHHCCCDCYCGITHIEWMNAFSLEMILGISKLITKLLLYWHVVYHSEMRRTVVASLEWHEGMIKMYSVGWILLDTMVLLPVVYSIIKSILRYKSQPYSSRYLCCDWIVWLQLYSSKSSWLID